MSKVMEAYLVGDSCPSLGPSKHSIYVMNLNRRIFSIGEKKIRTFPRLPEFHESHPGKLVHRNHSFELGFCSLFQPPMSRILVTTIVNLLDQKQSFSLRKTLVQFLCAAHRASQ